MNFKKALQEAFSKKERAERLMVNLENLKRDKAIDEKQYASMKNEYAKTLNEANLEIGQIKNQISVELTARQRDLDSYNQNLKNLELRFNVGELKTEEYQRASQNIRKKIESTQQKLSELKGFVESKSSAEVGGYVETVERAKGVSTGGINIIEQLTNIVEQLTASPKKLIAVIAGILIIIGGLSLLWSSGPEKTVEMYWESIDEGQYGKAFDLLYPQTLEPSAVASAKREFIRSMESAFGMLGERIQVKKIALIEKTIRSDGNSAWLRYRIEYIYDRRYEEKFKDAEIVKFGGEWKIRGKPGLGIND